MNKTVTLLFTALFLTWMVPTANALPGCDTSEGPGCAGCACEGCVCAMDSFCCEFSWDSLCVSECIEDCGGCVELLNCGDGNCNPDEFENCTNCAEDCACPDGASCYQNDCCTPFCDETSGCQDDGCGGVCPCNDEAAVCFAGECCVPSCVDKECGSDGCGGDCGDCGPGKYCTDEFACLPIPPCDVVQPLHCDDVLQIDNANGTSIIDQYDCVGWNESSPELGFSFDSAVEDTVVFSIEPTGDADLDIFLMEGSCTPDSCLDYGSSEVSVKVMPGTHYYITVDGYNGQTGPGVLTVWCQSTCEPACEGKMCGDDGCGGQCGECAGTCMEGLCHEGPGCESLGTPTCDDCTCQECVCAMDPYCCETAWDGICVSECIGSCGGCLELPNCGDGACLLGDYETCANCPEDCACSEGESCYQNLCCQPTCDADSGCLSDGCGGVCPCADPLAVCSGGECCMPSCDGKACGDDGCGGWCGDCGAGFYCDESYQCIEPTCAGKCGGSSGFGCYCDESCFEYGDCCNDVCDFCAELDPNMLYCADLSNCGNGSCDVGVGEDCENCPSDCTCAGGEVCGVVNGGSACLQDMCAEGVSDLGCCYDGVLYACQDEIVYALDCGAQESVCGWYEGDFQYTPGYYCGPDDLIDQNGDPSGENPMDCVSCDPPCLAGEKCVESECVPCLPACSGKNCGPDGCGGVCGQCAEGLFCNDGNCALPPVQGCEALDGPGCGGCACEACVCAMDAFCCDTLWDDICAGECVDSCGGCPEPDPFCGDMACNGDEDCGSCPGDCTCPPGQACDGSSCVECLPACEGLECGDDGCGGSCGVCGDEEECVGGLCQGPCQPDCTGLSCGDDGCGGICGECEEGESCVAGDCQAEELCGNGALDAGEQCEVDSDCGTAAVCEECQCVIACVPDCTDKACGDDGCGDSCGACGAGESCDDLGQCLPLTGDDVVGSQDVVTHFDQVGGDVAPGEDVGGEEPKKKDGGCSAAGGETPRSLALLALVLMALVALRRRRITA